MRSSAACIAALATLLALPCGSGMAQDDRVPAPKLTPETSAALDALRQKPAWLFPADDCPADVMAVVPLEWHYSLADCQADLEACRARCEAGNGNECFAVAQSVQALRTDAIIAEALFLRACRLGIATGCTNRAAGMINFDPSNPVVNACAARTFRMSCERDDPWGCTMYGYHLMYGLGLPKDLDIATRMLARACTFDESFIACTRAKELLQKIADERAGKGEQE